MTPIAEPLGLQAQLACLWEATARKAGNVHRFRDFADTTYLDFVASAAAVAPVFDASPAHPVGEIVLAGVQATRRVTAANTNLGILLLLAPLAKANLAPDFPADTERVLGELTRDDALNVYQAIRLANPGGLGKVAEGDIADEPDRGLRELMAFAADRDLIARQYANGFRELFDAGVPALFDGMARTGCLEGGILYAQLSVMRSHPDTLIARKLGPAEALESSARAAAVLDAGWPVSAAGRAAWHSLDAWLREPGNARNPGATADLLAACLFVMLRAQQIPLPLAIPWTRADLLQAG